MARSKAERPNTVIEDGNRPRMTSKAGRTPVPRTAAAVHAAPPRAGGRQLSPVPLRVWVVASKHKEDQLAGFAAYARTLELGPRTIPEWESAYGAFLSREVK